jgi:hypothetical protein
MDHSILDSVHKNARGLRRIWWGRLQPARGFSPADLGCGLPHCGTRGSNTWRGRRGGRWSIRLRWRGNRRVGTARMAEQTHEIATARTVDRRTLARLSLRQALTLGYPLTGSITHPRPLQSAIQSNAVGPKTTPAVVLRRVRAYFSRENNDREFTAVALSSVEAQCAFRKETSSEIPTSLFVLAWNCSGMWRGYQKTSTTRRKPGESSIHFLAC